MRKTADESVTSSTTLQNDDHLTFSIGANEVWVFDVFLSVASASDDPDIKIAFSVPPGATIRWGGMGPSTALSNPQTYATCRELNLATVSGSGTTSPFGLRGDSTTGHVHLWGTVVNGATAGSVTLQWAQNTSSTSATTVQANSSLAAHKQ